MTKNYLLLDKEELEKCIKDRAYCKEHYLDPDGLSKELYQDLQQIWNHQQPKLQFTEYIKVEYAEEKFCYNLLDSNGQRYSSDFLGLSVGKLHKAYQTGVVSLDEAVDYLTKTRTLGGHMIWPVHAKPTINTYRGEFRSYQDRFDLFLEDIKNFYVNRGTEKCICKSCTPFIENGKREKEFFLQFGDGLDGFQNFIHTWKLEPFLYGYHTGISQEKEEYYQVLCLSHSNLASKKIEPIRWNGKKYEENINDTIKPSAKRSEERTKQYFCNFLNNTKIVIQEREHRILK